MNQEDQTLRVNPSALAPSAGQSHVVVTSAARTAYISGQVAVDADGNVVGAADFAAQVQQVLSNLDCALSAVDATRQDVVKLTIFVVDLDIAVHGDALAQHLGDLSSFAHPAATLISVQGLARPEFQIEIEAVAALA